MKKKRWVLKPKILTTVYIIMCIIIVAALQVLIIRNAQSEMQGFNGILIALQYGVCLLIQRICLKKGMLISLLLMSVSGTITLTALLHGDISTLSGLANTVFYIVTLIALGKHHTKQETLSVTDPLTGLFNRRGLYNYLDQKITNREPCHVLYVDLGNFKFINNTYGHACGDTLLKIAASKICSITVSESAVARIGGDEFVVVLNQNLDPNCISNRIIHAISDKITVPAAGASVDCYLTCHIGISSYPQDTEDYEELVKYADMAMYEAASDKSIVPRHFNKEIAANINRIAEIEKFVKDGLKNDYFYLMYQPQYRFDGKKLRGFETLIRMRTPDGIFISPGEFIPVAERDSLILQIDDYVLHRAMREFGQIVCQTGNTLIISVNISAKNISSVGFVDKINRIMSETAFPPENLEIEITEYCMMQSAEVAIDNIKRLRGMGVQIALDDFGTGYTSLNYLAKMPVNLLKVDKSLIDDIEKNKKNLDFVQTVISLGHLMGCEVISEGVENENQLRLLGENDCDFIQGYVWSKPLDYSDAKDLSLGKK